MAVRHYFGNKSFLAPGAYSVIQAGFNSPGVDLSYGNILLIDTGSNTVFGGGAGINGELSNGKSAVYKFRGLREFQQFVQGGLHWKLGEPLFNPARNAQGVSSIYYVRAATTIAAKWDLAFGTGANDATMTIKCLNEGTVGNGVLTGTALTKGYALNLIAGSIDSNKFQLEIWRGTYRGTDSYNGYAYDFVDEADSSEELILRSVEVASVAELITWLNSSPQFLQHFEITASTTNGTSAILAADLVTYTDFELAAGGTITFNAADLDDVLEAVDDLDYTFILCDDVGDDATGTNNTKLLYHAQNESRFEKILAVTGGNDSTKFSAVATSGHSFHTSNFFNTDNAFVVHGAPKISTSKGLIKYPAIYKTALFLGRIAGVEPQTPGTFKDLNMQGEVHELTLREREDAIEAGIVTTYYDVDFKRYTVTQSVTSLQLNSALVNPDASTSEISIKRIALQLNKELVVNAKIRLLTNPTGVNLNTLTDQDLEDFAQGYLLRKVATPTDDNLIISFQNIQISQDQDAKFVSYEFKPNYPVNKLFFTGFMLSPDA